MDRYTTAKWEYLRLLFLTDLDNDDKPKGLMEANVNIMQVSVALNQGMISFTTLCTAELSKRHK